MTNKKIIFSTLIALFSVLAVSTIVIAATNMNPDAAPNPTVGTMKTLNDIYHRITEGTAEAGHTLNPALGPTTGTMHTLTEIYDAISMPLVWSTEVSGLCWDTDPEDVWNTEENCNTTSPGGWLTTPLGTPVGAVEYCKYLNDAGTALTDSIGVWRLPTFAELMSALVQQFFPDGIGALSSGSFQYDINYWSGSLGDDVDSPYGSYTGFLISGYASKGLQYSVRCVR